MVLLVTAVVGGTMAFYADTDSDVNVMTLGNVKIEQHEYERKVDADGNYTKDTIDGVTSYKLKDFTQGKPLYPIVGDPSSPEGYPHAGWDDTTVRMSQVNSYGGMPVFAGKNAQDKFVTVENTGKNDAYIRTIVAIEVGTGNADLIGTSYHSNWSKNAVGKVEIDGNNYYVYEYIYKGASDGSRHVGGVLPAGETSYPNLSQVYLKSAATNKDVEDLDGNDNGTLDILVLSQAVQAEGFANAQTALDTAFGKSSEKAAEWFGGTSIPTVSSAAELTAALAAGENVVLADDITTTADASNGYGKTGVVVNAGNVLDGAGNTYTVTDANTTWDSVIAAKGGTIKNLTVAKGFRGIFMPGANGDLYIDNVVFKDVVYTFNSDAGSKDYGVYISNSTLNGWTSYSNVHKEVVFTNCEFGEGSGYAFLRAYNNTEFVNCNFSAGFEVQVESGAVAKFENCYYNGTLITAGNIDTLDFLVDTDASSVTVK